MGWQDSAPSLPSGSSWINLGSGSYTANKYSVTVQAHMARMEKNNICVRFKLSTSSGSSSTYKPPDYMDFRVKINGATNTKSYNWAANQPWVSDRTVYWTGTLNKNDGTNATKVYVYAGAHDVGGAVFSHATYLSKSGTGPGYLAPVYTITYHANNGGSASSTQPKTYGYTAEIRSNSWTKAGYTFVGWAKTSSATTAQYQPGQSYSTNADMTLYAIWAPDSYDVSYNGNGSTSGSTSGQTKTYGVALTLRGNGYTKTGHHFLRWNTKADGTGTGYAAGGSYTANAAVTLYAIWEPDTYTVSYEANGAESGATAAQTKTYGRRMVIADCGFVRNGWGFTGWNTAEDGSGTGYGAGDYYETDAPMTLYAQWRKLNIPVFINDDGTVKQVEKAYINDNGTIKECTVYFNDNGTIVELS